MERTDNMERTDQGARDETGIVAHAPDSPELPVRGGRYFLQLYKDMVASIREQNAKRREEAAQAAATPPPAVPNAPDLSIGPENLPEEYLEKPAFLDMMRLKAELTEQLCREYPDTDDPKVAAIRVTQWKICEQAKLFLARIVNFLIFDARLHPERKAKFEALGVLGFDRTAETMIDDVCTLMNLMALCNKVVGATPANMPFAREAERLRKAGTFFFTLVHSIFPLPEVGKCQQAFILLMDRAGHVAYREAAENYVRILKATERAIARHEKEAGGMAAVLERNTREVQRNTARMDRIERELHALFAWLREFLRRFALLFRPGRPAPTREQVAAQSTLAQKYALLDRTKEPHRTQIMRVIEYTQAHPIVRKEEKVDGLLTLADAVRAVWLQNEATWLKIAGTFSTYDDLKSACYSLARKSNDPFFYKRG